MAEKLDLDETTLRIMQRMVNMPPKPHEKMKLGKRKASRAKSPVRKRGGGTKK